MKKDYGFHLASIGVPAGTANFFYSVPIDHISIVDINLFSMSLGITVEEQEYMVTFNFDEYFLWKIMKFAPADVFDAFSKGLKGVTRQPETLEFPRKFYIGIQAVMGSPQVGQHEKYIPFNIKDVFSA